MWARIHLIPALQAEEDRDQVRRYLADKARERELLGSETRVYNSDRYGLGSRATPKKHTNLVSLALFARRMLLHLSMRPNDQKGLREYLKALRKACVYRGNGVPRIFYVRVRCFNTKVQELQFVTCVNRDMPIRES
jgi:hypothetical protein